MEAFSHQKQTTQKLIANNLLFDQSEPGTGKTRAQIDGLRHYFEKDSAHKALITATLSTTRSAWANDFAKFFPECKVVVALAPKLQEMFSKGADVFITNHDSVKWLADNPAVLKQFQHGTVIHDESTVFKHHTSQRSVAAMQLSRAIPIRRMMSGLADPNGLTDLWNQYRLLDFGQRLGGSFSKFKDTFYSCQMKWISPTKQVPVWAERENAARIISHLTQDITVKHLFEECVDMPPNFKYDVVCPLAPKAQRAYEKFAKDLLVEIDGKVILALNKAVLRTKLLQFASGAVYNESGDSTTISNERYVFVCDLVQEVRHSIVFFIWAHQRDGLVKEATKRGLRFAVYDGTVSSKNRDEITERYQAGELDVIFAQPHAAAHGLTWVRGTRTIWASPTDNYEHWVQGNKRVYRIGQTERTETILVYAPNTYDTVCVENLLGKKVRSDNYTAQLCKILN